MTARTTRPCHLFRRWGRSVVRSSMLGDDVVGDGVVGEGVLGDGWSEMACESRCVRLPV